jgi:inosose dehydratase
MTPIKVANAPCSWGALEFDLEAEAPGYKQVISEIEETGYSGTELGDWDFMPTDPEKLRDELQAVNLDLIGAFVPVDFVKAESHDEGVERALRVAGLMHAAGYPHAFIVLADNNGSVPERTQKAGRIQPEHGLSSEQWKTYVEGVEKVAQAVKDKYGMRSVFHHHCAGYVETPEELGELMNRTNPELLGLCFDTGHYTYGGGNAEEGLKLWKERIWHVHFKDYSASIGDSAKEKNWDYFEAVKNGVFCELGKGEVDFPAAVKFLKETGYQDWIVVEQDVLPGMGSPKDCALNNRKYLKSLDL